MRRDRRAGERAAVVDELSARRGVIRRPCSSKESGPPAAGGIASETSAIPPDALGRDGGAAGEGMDVLAVRDQAADDARIGEDSADDARRAGVQLAHRVEEVGRRPRAGVEHGLRLLRARLRMAEGDDDPRLGEPRDERQRNGGGRERDDHCARARRDQRIGVGLAHRTDPLRRVDALASRIDERALDMNAERAGHLGLRLARGGQRRSEHLPARR